MSKTILYIANVRLPTEKAHGFQIMKMCESFALAGHKLTLVAPFRFNAIKENAFTYYAIKKVFDIKKVFAIDLVSFGKIGFLVESITYSFFAFVYALLSKSDLVYGRDEIALYFLSFFKKSIVFEAHTAQYNVFARALVRKDIKIACISHGLKDFYIQKGVHENKIFVAPDAVALDEFSNEAWSKEKCRKELSLPTDKNIVMYTGHLYGWKGASVLAKAAALFKNDTVVVFVGGTDGDIKRFKSNYKDERIQIVGRVRHEEIPKYLCAADVLVIPNSCKTDISKLYTSPMKLFEYMASGRPIVSSNLPSLREVIDEETAVFFDPDDEKSLSETIQKLLSEPQKMDQIVKSAKENVAKYSWENRVKIIFEQI